MEAKGRPLPYYVSEPRSALVNFETVFIAILASVVAYFLFSIFRHGGFKGAMFGARVLGQVGEVSAPRRGFMSQKLKVHVLEAADPSGPAIGIELSSSGPGAWSMTPVSLTSSDARQLVRLLEQAADADYRARTTTAA